MALRSLLLAALLGILVTGCNKKIETPEATPASAPVVATPAAAPPVVVQGNRANFTITRTAEGYTLADKSGKEPAINVKAEQRIRFSDITMSLDTKGNPGAAYRLYYAAFNRAPDHAGLGYWLKALDGGMSLEAIAEMMVSSAEFAGMYAPTMSDEELVRTFYKNVLRKDADAVEIAGWQAKLASKSVTRAQALAAISSGDVAQKADQLGLEKGIFYTEEGVQYAPFASANADPIVNAAAPATK